ncbi:MAG TPA: hypothetical protein VM123_08180 [archaeon]|nr:hypothetical protein [archaeon]
MGKPVSSAGARRRHPPLSFTEKSAFFHFFMNGHPGLFLKKPDPPSRKLTELLKDFSFPIGKKQMLPEFW